MKKGEKIRLIEFKKIFFSFFGVNVSFSTFFLLNISEQIINFLKVKFILDKVITESLII